MKLIGRAFWEKDRDRPGRWAHKYRDDHGTEKKLRVPREIAPTQRERVAAEEWVRAEAKRIRTASIDSVTIESIVWTVGGLWLRDKRISKATRDDYSGHLRHHILPAFGNMPPEQLDMPVVRQWVRKMRNEGASRSGISNRLATLAKLLDDAKSERLSPIDGDIARHPAVRSELPDAPSKSARTITARSFTMVLDAPTTPLVWAVRYALAGLAGLEDGAIAGLKWKDIVSFNGVRVLNISRTIATRGEGGWASEAPTKNDYRGTAENPRRIPVHRGLGVLIDRWLAEYVIWTGHEARPDDWLLPLPNGRPWRPRSAEELRKHCETARVIVPVDFGVHRLRGCFMTWLAATGADKGTRDRLVGHAGEVDQRHYLGWEELIPLDHAAIERIAVDLSVRHTVHVGENGGPSSDKDAGDWSHLRDLNSRPTVYEGGDPKCSQRAALLLSDAAPSTGPTGSQATSWSDGTNAAKAARSEDVGPPHGPLVSADEPSPVHRLADELLAMIGPFEAAEATLCRLS